MLRRYEIFHPLAKRTKLKYKEETIYEKEYVAKLKGRSM